MKTNKRLSDAFVSTVEQDATAVEESPRKKLKTIDDAQKPPKLILRIDTALARRLSAASSASTPTPSATSTRKKHEDSVKKAISYGSYSKVLKPEDGGPEGHTHSWQLFVQGYQGTDISHWLKHVVFNLHPSFAQPKRIITEPPFSVSETGWGEFEVSIDLVFRDPRLRPVRLYHLLKLYPLDSPPDQNIVRLDAEPVMYERYDELLFLNPQTPFMNEIFSQYDAHQSEYPNHHCIESTLSDETEEQEQLVVAKALDVVKRQLREWQDKKDQLHHQVQQARDRLVTMRGGVPSKTITLRPESRHGGRMSISPAPSI